MEDNQSKKNNNHNNTSEQSHHNNNHSNRKDDGFRPSGDRPPRAFGDRPSRGGFRSSGRSGFRPSGDRPPRAFGDRPPRPYSDRPSGDRPPRAFGDRPPRPYSDRPSGDRPPRAFGDRPPRAFGDRPSGDRPPRAFGDRPPRPYNDRPSEGGFRSSGRSGFRPSGDRPPRAFGDRPPRAFGDRPPRPFGDRPSRSFGDRPPRPYSDRSSGDRPPRPFGDRPSGNRPPRAFGDRPQRPYNTHTTTEQSDQTSSFSEYNKSPVENTSILELAQQVAKTYDCKVDKFKMIKRIAKITLTIERLDKQVLAVETCAQINKDLSKLVEIYQPDIRNTYDIEVSSVGIDRQISFEELHEHIGTYIKVHYVQNDKNIIKRVLLNQVLSDQCIVTDSNHSEFSINYDIIVRIRLSPLE